MSLFSDTVGFITDLPTQLIAAFQATLEQVEEADVILHVADRAAVDFEDKQAAVLQTLSEIGVEESDERIINVWNKADLLDLEASSAALRKARFADNAVLVSAVTGQGIDKLLEKIDEFLLHGTRIYTFKFPSSDGSALAFLQRHGDNQTIKIKSSKNGETLTVDVAMSDIVADRFTEKFTYAQK